MLDKIIQWFTPVGEYTISKLLPMIALFALLVLGIAVFHFDALASILAALFPSVVIRVLQILEARKAPETKGSDNP